MFRKIALTLLFLFVACGCANIFAEELKVGGMTVSGEYSLIGALHRTGGSGDRTFLRRGDFLTHRLQLRLEDKLSEDWNWDTNIDLRQTHDQQIDEHDGIHLLGWTSELYSREWSFTLGDFFGDFSQYTLSQALDGAQIHFHNENTEVKAVVGMSQRQNDTHFLRMVAGARVETLVAAQVGPLENIRVGTNFTDAEDDHASITQSFPTGIADASNRNGSVNFSGTLWKKTEVEGEVAKTWIDEDTSPNTSVHRKDGTAVRVNSATRYSKDTKLRLGYEWVSADFQTLAGSAVPDRVSWSSRLDHKLNSEWSSEAAYRLTYDKLDKSTLNKRTMTQMPHLALNWVPDSEIWTLKDYTMRFFWDMRSRTSDDDPTGQTDFLGNDYGIENEFKIERVNFNSGWTLHTETDDLRKVNALTENTVYFGMRMREKMDQTTVVPGIRYQLDYPYQPKTDQADLTQTLTLSLGLEPSERLKIDQRCSLIRSARALGDSDSLKANAHIGLEYKLPTSQDLTYRLGYDYTGYAHSQSVQSFSEHNLQTELLWRF